MIRFLKDPKPLAALAAFAYGMGFLIETVRFGALGAYSTELARTRYVVTGFVFLLFVAACVYPFIAAARSARRASNAGRKPVPIGRFLISASFFAGAWATIVSCMSTLGAPARPDAAFGVAQIPLGLVASNFLKEEAKHALYLVVGGGVLWIATFVVRCVVLLVQRRFTWSAAAKGALIWVSEELPWRPFALFSLAIPVFLHTRVIYELAAPGTLARWPLVQIDDQWLRYFVLPLLFQVAVFLFLLCNVTYSRTLHFRRGGTPPLVDEQHSAFSFLLVQHRTLLYFFGALTACALVVLPYSLFVFPELPQHLGGGMPVRAFITTRQPLGALDGGTTGTFLVLERGSTLLLQRPGTPRFLDVPASLVESMEFQVGAEADAGTVGMAAGTAGSVDSGLPAVSN